MLITVDTSDLTAAADWFRSHAEGLPAALGAVSGDLERQTWEGQVAVG